MKVGREKREKKGERRGRGDTIQIVYKTHKYRKLDPKYSEKSTGIGMMSSASSIYIRFRLFFNFVSFSECYPFLENCQKNVSESLKLSFDPLLGDVCS